MPKVADIEIKRRRLGVAAGRRPGGLSGVSPMALLKARAAAARLKSGENRVLSEAEERVHLRARQASSRRIAAILKKSRSR